MSSVTEKERIISLDIMRGFAILGIFLVNMLSFHSPFLYIDPLSWWTDSSDQTVYSVIDVLVQASFYPLFALLFGYSVIMLRERVLKKELSFNVIAVRRFSFLLLLGLGHAFFLWFGDILAMYAVLAFIFLLFVKMNGKNMLITGLVIYIIPNLLLCLLLFAAELIFPPDDLTLYDNSLAEEAAAVYHTGTFTEITSERIKDWYANNVGGFPVMLISILPLFLIGGGAAKLKLLENAGQRRSLFRNMAIITFVLGLVIKLLPYIMNRSLALDYVQDTFGGPLLAVAYGSFIAWAVGSMHLLKLLKPLAYIGKMSLSNYLFQSLLCSILFYGYGFGLFGEISVVTGTVLVIIIFFIQLLFSRFYAKRFLYGPVEWVWRSFTYWEIPKMKK
ncbi:DUF418 domain-containing protein [Bacillus mesophilum]|uniref:DUF418 domain-containing protein n=1 Tax=Bacillus mesophilum TaxID=1071718 RepID=A0A7V7RJB8_9BACI|nr:DUF418 domain-containing protein [Bacillus mesophilum]KAB2330919.1 DUF418 domain-containing protein [Bacillus mesophilum]